jgi:hypothetical protein
LEEGGLSLLSEEGKLGVALIGDGEEVAGGGIAAGRNHDYSRDKISTCLVFPRIP